jgi:pyruvate/2-oxoglutarate dehydrogenase complex dihydrolipoamide acyltransferase (E2) component
MAHAVHAPRVNNNDDTVTVVRIAVAAGDFVRPGDLILEVETEKAAIAVEAEQDGHVLLVRGREGDTFAVGDVVVWLGDTPDEAVPEPVPDLSAPDIGGRDFAADEGVTGKARLLLSQHGLAAEVVPRLGSRLTAADVQAYVAGLAPTAQGGIAQREAVQREAVQREAVPKQPAQTEALPAPADLAPLRSGERAVLATVTWQRDHAAAAFLEIEYDPRVWREHGADFARGRRLLLDPTLALMAHRLALLAAATGANGTVLEQPSPRRVRYRQVNLGFTVQARETLYLCVVERAETLDPEGFVARLGELQRRAMAHRLAPAEARGATVGFTSMARWGVLRHVPILPPYCALMVAHGDAFDGGARAVLGVTYDHRLLSGFDAVRLLRLLADPARDIPNPRI